MNSSCEEMIFQASQILLYQYFFKLVQARSYVELQLISFLPMSWLQEKLPTFSWS